MKNYTKCLLVASSLFFNNSEIVAQQSYMVSGADICDGIDVNGLYKWVAGGAYYKKIDAIDSIYLILVTYWELSYNVYPSIWDNKFYNPNVGSNPPLTGWINHPINCPDATPPTLSIILPIELTSFSILERNNSHIISWGTITETQNADFEIQRSSNAQDWTTLGFITGAGNSSEEIIYEYTDRSPMPGINYYRLRQVDLDGTDAFSEIISVLNGSSADVSIYLNPTSNRVFVNGMEESLASLNIYNHLGRKAGGVTYNIGGTDVSFLPPGLYIIEIKSKSNTYYRQFVKE